MGSHRIVTPPKTQFLKARFFLDAHQSRKDEIECAFVEDSQQWKELHLPICGYLFSLIRENKSQSRVINKPAQTATDVRVCACGSAFTARCRGKKR